LTSSYYFVLYGDFGGRGGFSFDLLLISSLLFLGGDFLLLLKIYFFDTLFSNYSYD
jgi:hypothetical protein